MPLLKGDTWNKINAKLTKLFNYPKYTCASKRGNKYFYFHNRSYNIFYALIQFPHNYLFPFSGLQNQNVVYFQKTLMESEDRKVFLDPNELSSDGTVSLQFLVFSHDGSKAAFGLSAYNLLILYFYELKNILFRRKR